MIRAVGILFLALPIGAVMICLPDDDCDGPVLYGISRIETTNLRFATGEPLGDTIEAGVDIRYEQFAIRVVPVADYVALQMPSKQVTWFSSVYACDPAVNPTDELTSISIVSDVDFTSTSGQTVTAGNTLTAFFEVGNEYGMVSEGLSRYNEQLPQPAYDRRIVLVLNTPPAEPQTHRFTVRYQLADGRELRAATAPVVISG